LEIIGKVIDSNNMKLRPYQTKLIAEIAGKWQSGKRRVIAVAPTGSGKTVLFAKIADRHLNDEPNGRVWIIAHRIEMLLQARQKIEAMSERRIGKIDIDDRIDPSAEVYICSIQSLTARLPEITIAPTLIIIDEVHHAIADSYQEVLRKFPTTLVLGVTATPIRADGNGFRDSFDELVCAPGVKELIEQGYLAPFKVFGAKMIDLKDVKRGRYDYNRQSLVDEIDRTIVYGDLLSAYRQYANNTKTVIFCVDVEHSRATAAAYKAAGIPAEHIDGEMDWKNRSTILGRFRSGETMVLCNCELILEGFDLDNIQTVQIVRPTASLSLYLQMVGRVLRPHPDKDYARIIDHTSNIALFGLPDEERYWSLDPVSAMASGWTEKCPSCDHIFHPIKAKVNSYRQMAGGVPRQFGRTICPNCQTNIQFLLRKPGLLFNSDIPAQIVLEEQSSTIVEIEDAKQIKIRGGDKIKRGEQTVNKIKDRIHPDHRQLIDNIISDAQSNVDAIEIISNLDTVADFGIDHWQYIGAKLQYRPEWGKNSFYKYTVRKRFNIQRGEPDSSISEIFEIVEELPTDGIFDPSNWTVDLAIAEKYVSFARLQRKTYHIVKLTRIDVLQWQEAPQLVEVTS
jgi:superfamily II DNA or RNA helicase